MLTDIERGRYALDRLGDIVEPTPQFIGSDAKALYRAEERAHNAIRAAANEWAKLAVVPEKSFWKRSLPQALFDLLRSYQTECAIVVAEAFLKAHGWTVERPNAIEVKAEYAGGGDHWCGLYRAPGGRRWIYASSIAGVIDYTSEAAALAGARECARIALALAKLDEDSGDLIK